MSYRVCIPVAGTGSRLGGLTRYVNKSLVTIANRPILSHIIEQFPDDTEFVFALGHKGSLVRDFLELAYPDRQFYFAEVTPYEGEGSGLGLSLLRCKHLLQQPFIFTSCDTLVREQIPAPTRNWMGYAPREDLSPYRTVELDGGRVLSIQEKGCSVSNPLQPYIGLAGILDYAAFWESMEAGGAQAIQAGEAHGLRALFHTEIQALEFTWYDTGVPSALEKAREAYREEGAPHILEKANEAIWFIGNRVIKFSDDKKFISNRVLRAAELKGFGPQITASRPQMYAYEKVEGKVLSEVATVPLMARLLTHSLTFWTKQNLAKPELEKFRTDCRRFYYDKTLERVELFHNKCNHPDDQESINGIPMPTLHTLLEKVDWDWISEGIPSRFHGDFHFENILWNSASETFSFLDWRQDFAGSINTGDIYYDFAKLLHGLIICHEIIDRNLFSITWLKGDISYDFHRKQILVDCEKFFTNWLLKNGYDTRKVYTLTALIFLNIAPLHHHPYDELLFALGKKMLNEQF